MFLVDSHCHLDYPDFAEEGAAGIVDRAALAGVGCCLTICTKLAEFPGVLKLAERDPRVFCTVGTHPHHAAEAGEVDVSSAELAALTRHPRVVGIGETGLDYYYSHSPAAEQQKVFSAHIAAAVQTGLPLIVHTRDADADTIRLMHDVGGGKARGVMHCFSGGMDLARKSLDLGFYISFSGIVTFKKADALRDVAKFVPSDRILVETDSPYLAPVPHRGKRNEPAFVVHTASVVAELRGISLEKLAGETTRNFFALFGKAQAPKGALS